jgi:hypothetical protein
MLKKWILLWWRHAGRQRGAAEETRGRSGAWRAQRKLEVVARVHRRGKAGGRERERGVRLGLAVVSKGCCWFHESQTLEVHLPKFLRKIYRISGE